MYGLKVCSGSRIEVTGAPEQIKILPLGHVKTEKGNFDVDDESVESIIEHFKNRKIDLVIDYEHQTLSDMQAPAGGWIKELQKGDDAIVAKVEWTPKAKEYLNNKEYRYLSPVVLVSNSDRKARQIHSVALTNTPAIDGMFAVVNSIDIEKLINQETDGGKQMELKELAKTLGLPETASEEDVKKKLGELLKAEKALEEHMEDAAEEKAELVANSTILGLLNLSEDAKTEDVASAIMALSTSTSSDTEEKLRMQIEERAADDLVEVALKSGKISAAQKSWAKQYALKDQKGFKAFMEKAPGTVPMGRVDNESNRESQKSSDADVDITILKNCGLSQEDLQKYTYMEV